MDEMDYVMHSPPAPSTPQLRHPLVGVSSTATSCPGWRVDHAPTAGSNPNQNPNLAGFTSPNRFPVHPHYDPVHHAPGGPWYGQPPPAFPWSSGSMPGPQPFARFPPPDSFYGGPGVGPSGPSQPSLGPNGGQISPPQDPLGPFAYPYRHAQNLPRMNTASPFVNTSADHQQSPPAPPSERHVHGSRNVSLPSLPFPPGQLRHGPGMSTSADSSPSSTTPSRLPLTSAGESSPHRHTHGQSMAPFSYSGPLSSVPLSSILSNRQDPSLPAARRGPSLGSEPPASVALPIPQASSNADRRRPLTARYRIPVPRLPTAGSFGSGGDSEDEVDSLDEEQLRTLEQFAGASTLHEHIRTLDSLPGAAPVQLRFGDMDEERLRAHQVFRGSLSNKRVASRSAIASLLSVDIDSLPESERTCVICYNEFGVANPEGINEAPLRLPKCKHIFGDHCIKKWFEDSDSCPYCRDKVPSEPQVRANPQAIRDFLRHHLPRGRQLAVAAAAAAGGSGSSAYARLAQAYQPETELYMHMLRATDDAAAANAPPPRNWQAGERRSPPSDATGRRTRARHGSMRFATSSAPIPPNNGANTRPSSFAGNSQLPQHHQQQHPVRGRSHPPFNDTQHNFYAHLAWHHLTLHSLAHGSLTSTPVRQFSNHGPHRHPHFHSVGGPAGASNREPSPPAPHFMPYSHIPPLDPPQGSASHTQGGSGSLFPQTMFGGSVPSTNGPGFGHPLSYANPPAEQQLPVPSTMAMFTPSHVRSLSSEGQFSGPGGPEFPGRPPLSNPPPASNSEGWRQ